MSGKQRVVAGSVLRQIVKRERDNPTFDSVTLECGHFEFLPHWETTTHVHCRVCAAERLKELARKGTS